MTQTAAELDQEIVGIRSGLARLRMDLAKAKQAKDEKGVARLEGSVSAQLAILEALKAKRETADEAPTKQKVTKGGNGKKEAPKAPKTRDPKPEAKAKPVRGKEGKVLRQCACGCGAQMAGKGYFQPGHDGRLTGQFKQVFAKKMKVSELNDTAQRMLKAWEKAGRPGGDGHPKLREVAVSVMGK